MVGEGGIDLRVDHGRNVIVVGGEDAAGTKQTCGLDQNGIRLHPVERLRAGDDVGVDSAEAGVGGVGLDVVDVGLLRRSPRALDHVRVRFDADYALGALCPNTGRETGARTEVDDEARPLGLGDQCQDVEEFARWREAIAVVEIGEVLALVA